MAKQYVKVSFTTKGFRAPKVSFNKVSAPKIAVRASNNGKRKA